MRAIIVDNEPNIIEGLKFLLTEYCPLVDVIDTARDIMDARSKIERLDPDILFLDVELDSGTGIDLLNQLSRRDFQLIFITAYNQYAIEAFRYSAIDYLLKPIDPDDLVLAVKRASEIIKQKNDQIKLQVLIDNLQNLSKSEKKIVVSDRDHLYAVDINDIIYLKADGPYTRIQRTKDYIYASKNLKHFQNLLQFAGFCRVHHSYLVNLKHMQRFNKSESVIELNMGDRIPVSVRKKEGLLAAIKGHQ